MLTFEQSFQQAFAKKPENAIAERNESKSRARSARDFSGGPGEFLFLIAL